VGDLAQGAALQTERETNNPTFIEMHVPRQTSVGYPARTPAPDEIHHLREAYMYASDSAVLRAG
jgi:hypothetical protein